MIGWINIMKLGSFYYACAGLHDSKEQALEQQYPDFKDKYLEPVKIEYGEEG